MDTQEIQDQLQSLMDAVHSLTDQMNMLQDKVAEMDDVLRNHKHKGYDQSQKIPFTSLLDAPSNYEGSASYYVKVNATKTGLTLSAT